jgi:hypothetical protein
MRKIVVGNVSVTPYLYCHNRHSFPQKVDKLIRKGTTRSKEGEIVMIDILACQSEKCYGKIVLYFE